MSSLNPPVELTSFQNPVVKSVVRLHQKKYRQEDGCILIEGRHPLEEALAANLPLRQIFWRDDETPQETAAEETYIVSSAVMGKLSTTDSPPPVVAVADLPEISPFTQALTATDFILGMADIQDPGNVGTMVRSACAFGATGLLVLGNHADIYQPKIIRASAGMVFRLPLFKIAGTDHLANWAAYNPTVKILGTDAHGGTSYRDMDYTGPLILLMGSEAHGLPESVWAYAKPLHIPMAPTVESLNVGVASAILMAEAFQNRLLPLSNPD